MSDDLPHSPTAEAALISGCLADPSVIPVLASKVSADEFWGVLNRKAWAAMVDLSQQGKPVDITTLALRGVDIGRNDLLSAPATDTLDECASVIRRDATRRKLIGALDRAVRTASTNPDVNAVLEQLHQVSTDVAVGRGQDKLWTTDRALDAYARYASGRSEGTVGLAWVSPLDGVLDPAEPGELIVVAARPGVGKTILGEMIADHWSARAEHPVLFVSLEMTLNQLLDRAASRATGIPLQRVRYGPLTPEERAYLTESLDNRRGLRVSYLSDPGATTTDIRSAVARVRLQAGGVSAIVVDYLQKMGDKPNESLYVKAGYVSQELKKIALENSAPLVAMAQFNRASEARETTRPKLSDLRDSGNIEQDADTVVAITRKNYPSEATFWVLKNRMGRTGRVDVPFDGDRVMFGGPDL